jgi:fused signal recognition particle receptor
VRFVGLGERADDLRPFHANDFVEALFGEDPSAAPEAAS